MTGGVWQWWALEGSDDTVQVVQNPADYTLQLARDGTFVGRADCNAVAGSWSADDAGLRLGEVAATLSVCDGGSWSEVYVQGLESVTGGGVSAEGELLLTLADGRMLRFQLAAP